MIDAHEIVKSIKQEFFAYRNGVVADVLKKAGDSHKLIFGVNLSQLNEMSSRYEKNAAVAQELWSSANSRECRLFAPMIYPCAELTRDVALEWINSVENIEIADNLCHKLLRHTVFAEDLVIECTSCDSEMVCYVGLRLAINLLSSNKFKNIGLLKETASEITKRSDAFASALAVRVVSECDESGDWI